MVILLALCYISLILQVFIFFRLKKDKGNAYQEVFDGVFFKGTKEHIKKVMRFYYNPTSWYKVKKIDVIFALILNFLIFIYVLGHVIWT